MPRGREPRVLWGRKRKLGGESHLVARSGLQFTTLTPEQQAALAETLHYFATVLQPIA